MIAVLGASGQLGSAFMRILGSDALAVGRDELDIGEIDAIRPWLVSTRPEVVINCAAFTDVDAAETNQETAYLVNAQAVGELARWCRQLRTRFVTFSSDYVFDGTKRGPYVESDRPAPLNVYGSSKAAGEKMALTENPDTLVVRTSWLLSSTHSNFLTAILGKLATGTAEVVDDQEGRPTIVDDLVPAVLLALEKRVSGLLHLTNSETTTWFDLATEIAAESGYEVSQVSPIPTASGDRRARRPSNSVLASERLYSYGLAPLPSYRDKLPELVRRAVD